MSVTARVVAFVAVTAASALLVPPARANDFWVDFTSDFHNGAGSATPNGVADWIDELNEATADIGVPDFTDEERAQIEANIVALLESAYADYQVDFVTSQPSGEHDVLYMARDDDLSDVGSSNLGSSPVDLGNQDTDTYGSNPDGNPSGVPKVTTKNFESNIESTDSRDQQILEFSTAVGNTAIHEVGHSFGLLHHFVYSSDSITPAGYGNTGGVQNRHAMSTGSTGATEADREVPRTLSPFSRVILDIAGGSNASSSEENNALTLNPIVSDRTEEQGADASDDLALATPLSFEIGEGSGLPISFLEADLDGSRTDVDVFTFTTASDSVLRAHVFSERLDLGNEFDPVLELLDGSGGLIASIDDTGWDDNVYNDLSSPEDEDDDPFLCNVPLDAGTYYLRVFATDTDISDTANTGDEYWLVTALDFETPALAGDYNDDGVVDGADYIVWRESEGAEGLGLPADGDMSGVVDGADYELWAANYGAPGDAGSLSVPEPASVVSIVLAVVFAVRRRSAATR